VLARFIATAKCVRARLQSCRKSKKDAGLQPLFFHLLAIAQRLKPGSKLVICGTTEQAAEKGMVSG